MAFSQENFEDRQSREQEAEPSKNENFNLQDTLLPSFPRGIGSFACASNATDDLLNSN